MFVSDDGFLRHVHALTNSKPYASILPETHADVYSGKRRKYAVYLTGKDLKANLPVSNLQKTHMNSGKCKMYVRYIAKYFNRETEKEETGIFRAADYVRDFTEICEAEKENLQKLIAWFDENLPVPDFYDDPTMRTEEQHTYFWFKTSAEEFLERMNELTGILKQNGVKAEILSAEHLPGKLVFEDYCQIAIVPVEDVLKIK